MEIKKIKEILKKHVKDKVIKKINNINKDKQINLKIHSRTDKKVYSYQIKHYEYWHNIFPTIEMPNGMFGENFTLEGLMETEVNVSDVFQI